MLILQFLKGYWHNGEHDAIGTLCGARGTLDNPSIIIRQLGRGFVKVNGTKTGLEDLKMDEDAWLNPPPPFS